MWREQNNTDEYDTDDSDNDQNTKHQPYTSEEEEEEEYNNITYENKIFASESESEYKAMDKAITQIKADISILKQIHREIMTRVGRLELIEDILQVQQDVEDATTDSDAVAEE